MIWPHEIRTARLTLRRPHDGDAPAVFEGYAADAEVTRYLTWRPHGTLEATRAFLRRCAAGWEAGTDLTWALTLTGDDRLIGMVGMRPRGHKPDIGYVMTRRHWGQGLMPEAAAAVVDLAFGDPAVYRVWAVCDVDNHASARVLEKIGMAREGVLRRWIVHPNVSTSPRDAYCYARVRSPTVDVE
jgi:RimJ/RimL family protein N-acetyltransferase